MRKIYLSVLASALVVMLAAGPVLAKNVKFTLFKPATINGTQLEPGKYTLKINDSGEAAIYDGRKLLTTMRVEEKAKANTSNSVRFDAQRNVLEIRTKKSTLVFVGLAAD